MKNWILLLKQLRKNSRNSYRAIYVCIIISVCLVSTIFGLADLGIKMEANLQKKLSGNYHLELKNITQEIARKISERSDVEIADWVYFEDDTSIQGKNLQILVGDQEIMYAMGVGVNQGYYPMQKHEVIVDDQLLKDTGKRIGESLNITLINGESVFVKIVGTFKDFSSLKRTDSHAIFFCLNPKPDFINENTYREFYVQFKESANIRKSMRDIKEQYNLSSDQISESMLSKVKGYGTGSNMKQLYSVAVALAIMVLSASSIMIAATYYTLITDKISLYGKMRCIGATKKQIKNFVILDAFYVAMQSIPLGIVLSIPILFLIIILLQNGLPSYFSEISIMPISLWGILAGIITGFFSITIASIIPAQIAAKASPIVASSGDIRPERNWILKIIGNKIKLPIDLKLGILHAVTRRRTLFFLTLSYMFSIVMLLGFQVLVEFTYKATPPLREYIPDLSIQLSQTNDRERLTEETCNILKSMSGVKNVYARSAFEGIEAVIGGAEYQVTLISYDELQFNWTEADLVQGNIENVIKENNTVLALYKPELWKVGEKISLYYNNTTAKVTIKGLLQSIPFDSNYRSDYLYLICSEKTYQNLIGDNYYSVIDIQLESDNKEDIIRTIYKSIPMDISISDRRQSNAESKALFYTMALFVYSFLIMIGGITLIFIKNIMNTSVMSRIRQYSIMHSLGIQNKQLKRMIITEALSYSLLGSICGCIIGVPLHFIFFTEAVTENFPTAVWKFPTDIMIIIVIGCMFVTWLSVLKPIKSINKICFYKR